MNDQNIPVTQPAEDELDLAKLFQLVVEHGKLFAVSIFLGLILAYAYIWYTPSSYQMVATVLVEDESSDISQSILDEVGVLGKKRNIENEIAIITSRNILGKAVSKLNLNISQQVDLGLRNRDLYLETPFYLDYTPNTDSETRHFTIALSVLPNGDSADLLFEFEAKGGENLEIEHSATFGESFSNELGKFRLTKTDLFDRMVLSDSALSSDYILTYRSSDLIVTDLIENFQVAEAREKASILKLTLKENVPQRGVDIVNAILSVYIQNNIEKKNQLAANSLDFIENQLTVISKELDSLEADIKLFKSSNGITDVSAESEYFLKQLGELDKSLSAIDVKLSIINYLETYIVSGKELDNASPSSLGIEDPLLINLISQLNELTAEKKSMLGTIRNANPVIEAIDSRIEEAKTALVNNIGSIRNGLNASKEELNLQLKKIESKVGSLPQAEYELLALQRQYTIKESLYLLLLEKKSENAIILASTISDNIILDQARSSDKPIAPKKSMIMLLGLIAGIGVPSLYLLYLLWFDDRIKTLDDLRAATSIPLAGIIPHNRDADYLVVEHNKNSPIAESFRSLRTNLSFLITTESDEKNALVIQFTSSVGSEGKSFCSINLAASLALAGHKTIVVGLDLRKPKLAEYFNLSNEVGTSSYLAGLSELDQVIMSNVTQNMDVLVAGPIPPNPSELLVGKRLLQLIDSLKETYDYVVLDTPPIGLVSDSLILSEVADTTIYIVRQGSSHASALLYMNELYSTKKIGSLSIVFNDVKKSRVGYGYGSYGYGYGGYGYGYSEKKKRWKLW